MRKEHTFTDVTCCVVIHLISVVEWAFFDGERVSIVVLLNLLLLEVCIIHIYLLARLVYAFYIVQSPSKCFFAEWSHIAHIIFYCTWEQFWLEAPSKQLYFWLLYKPACVSQHYQLRAGGFILERSFTASSPCWWKLGAFVFGDSCWSSMILF